MKIKHEVMLFTLETCLEVKVIIAVASQLLQGLT